MSALISLVLAFALTYTSVSADSTSLGKCPHVDPEPDFDMDKFCGIWYAIQRTSTDSPCLMYNITHKEGYPGHYLLTETYPKSKLASWVGLGSHHSVTGELCAEDEKTPAVMDLDIPYEIGSSKFTVFMTDYEHCAAIFSCKTYPLSFSRLRRWSAQILSRTPTLDIEHIEKIRNRLSAYNIDPFSLSRISHHHCDDDENEEPEHHVDSTKTHGAKVVETVQTSKDTSKVNKDEKNIVQTSFDQPEVFGLSDNSSKNVGKGPGEQGGNPHGQASGYSNVQPTQLP